MAPVCTVCVRTEARYTCPRCQTAYCSLECYQAHSGKCTESFYKSQVEEELKSRRIDEDERRRLEKVLASLSSLDQADEDPVFCGVRAAKNWHLTRFSGPKTWRFLPSLAMSLSKLLELDVEWTHKAQSISVGYLEIFIYPGSIAFSWEGVGISLTLAGLLCGFQPLRIALFALSYGQLLNRVLKMSFQRDRPKPPEVKRLFKAIIPKDSDADGAAFPSGDTMAGSVTGASLALAGCSPAWWFLGLYVP
eukprot:symbB.v1.2.013946.t1/scaffold1003.1/size206925/6